MKSAIKFHVLFTQIDKRETTPCYRLVGYEGPFDTIKEASDFARNDPRGGYNPWRIVQDYEEN